MSYIGDFRLAKTFDTKFCTVTTTGAPTQLASSPVISAYPDNSTTQLTAGITLTVDFDGVTGLNNIRVVATGGNGYATATNYQLVITTGTVGGTSVVGYVPAEFSIEARSALMPTTVDRTIVVDAAGLADANAVKVGPTGSGTAQTARDLGASVLLAAGQKVDVDTIKTNPVVNGGTVTFATNTTVANTTGAVGSVTGNVGGSVASIATNGIASGAFTAGAITATAIAANAITSAKIATDAIGAAQLAADAVTEIQTAVAAGAVASVTGAVGSVTAVVSANVTKINGTTVNGNGAGTPWGP